MTTQPTHMLLFAFAATLAQAASSASDLETKGIITVMPSGTRFGAWMIGGNLY